MKKLLTAVCGIILLSLVCAGGEAQGNQTVANGASTAPVYFTPWGCTYNWVNNSPSIGLPPSGRGDIPSFTAINSGANPVTATITVTPVPTGYAYIPDYGSNYVYVLDTTTRLIVDSVASSAPLGVAISADGKFVYVTNNISNGTVTVISTLTNTVAAII